MPPPAVQRNAWLPAGTPLLPTTTEPLSETPNASLPWLERPPSPVKDCAEAGAGVTSAIKALARRPPNPFDLCVDLIPRPLLQLLLERGRAVRAGLAPGAVSPSHRAVSPTERSSVNSKEAACGSRGCDWGPTPARLALNPRRPPADGPPDESACRAGPQGLRDPEPPGGSRRAAARRHARSGDGGASARRAQPRPARGEGRAGPLVPERDLRRVRAAARGAG